MTPAQRSPAVTAGLAAIVIALLALAGWAALAPLHGAVVGNGLVKAIGNRKLVQHPEGGIVKNILVRNGDRVALDQRLAELEDVRTDANLQLMQELTVFEAVRRERLDAEQQLSAQFPLPPALDPHADTALLQKAFQRELNIFRTRRSLLDQQLASFRRQLEAIDAEQGALRQQSESSRSAQKLARDELVLNEGLARDKFVSRARLIGLERAVAEYGAKLGEHDAMLAQSEQRKSELRLRMTSAQAEYQRLAAEEFKESHAKLVQLREQLRPVEDAARRKLLLSPAAGTVVGLRLNAVGELAPPRQTLMEIVPDGEALVVEANVSVDAIRHLKPGQTAELHFTTFSSRSTPLVRGQLSYVSADALVDADGVPHYVIQVTPSAASVTDAGIAALKPGMAAEVFILTDTRSVVDYLLAPVTDTLRRTLREP